MRNFETHYERQFKLLVSVQTSWVHNLAIPNHTIPNQDIFGPFSGLFDPFFGQKISFPHVLRFWQYFLVLVGPKGSEFIDRLFKPFFKTWSWLRAGVTAPPPWSWHSPQWTSCGIFWRTLLLPLCWPFFPCLVNARPRFAAAVITTSLVITVINVGLSRYWLIYHRNHCDHRDWWLID